MTPAKKAVKKATKPVELPYVLKKDYLSVLIDGKNYAISTARAVVNRPASLASDILCMRAAPASTVERC